MKPEIEPIKNNPNQSFKLGVYEGNTACMDDYWHIHPEYEIVYVHNGSGRRHIGTHISTYSSGVLLFLGPNIPHLPLGNSLQPDNFEIVVQFSESFLVDKLGAFPEFEQIKGLKKKVESGLAFGLETRQKLAPYIKPSQDLSPTDKLFWLMKLLVELSGAQDCTSLNAYGVSSEKGHADYYRVKLIFNHISHHFDEELSLDALAEKVGLTKNSLCRFFKKLTGQTVIDYLTTYRIGMAKEYLIDGSMNVSEVLYKCGFNDPSFFYRKFKASTGFSPKTYQRRVTSQSPSHQRSGHIHPFPR